MHYANDAKTLLKHFSDCLFYFCSTCVDSITSWSQVVAENVVFKLTVKWDFKACSINVVTVVCSHMFPLQLPFVDFRSCGFLLD